MKLQRDQLLPALNALMPIVGKRTVLNGVLNCIRLEAKGGKLSVRGSNIDCDHTLLIDCRATFPAICVPARPLHALVAGAEETLSIEPEDKLRVRFESRGSARLACMDAEQFIAEPDKSGKAIGVNAQDLSRGIKSVAWAAAPEPNDLSFVYVFLSAKEIYCIGTDRKTYAFCRIPAICAPCDFRIPTNQASLFVEALLTEGAQLHVGEKNAAVKRAGGELYVALPAGLAPDPRKIAQGVEKRFVGRVSVEALCEALATCRSLSADKFVYVSFTFSSIGVELDFNGGANGYQRTLPGKFEDFKIKMDAELMLKALKAFATEDVDISQWDNGMAIEGGELLVGIAGIQNT